MVAAAIFLLLLLTGLLQDPSRPGLSLILFAISALAIVLLFFHHSSLHLAISL